MWDTTNLFGNLMPALVFFCVFFIIFFDKIKKYLPELHNRNILSSIKILEIKTIEQCRYACSLLETDCECLNALGFDCEWVSVQGKHRPVALLQLATVHGLCCLFRLNILHEIPDELKKILLNSSIIKLGISPLKDAKFLRQDYKTKVCSTLDLRYLYQTGRGLAFLADSEIGVKLDKSWCLKCSDWEKLELTKSQKDYAAKDAFVAVEIFKKWLLKKNNQLHLYGTKILHYSQLLNKELKSELSRFLDLNFKLTSIPASSKYNEEKKNINYVSNSKKKEKSGYVIRKTPLYHNCFMHAPDGELLCSCDRRKAQWYLDRGLAEILPGEPFSIKLLFEPAARADETKEGRFYQQLKQNCCVVCGAVESYLRHNVVPKEYRMLFPKIMKNHQSHDIVLMCPECHHLATQHNENLRRKLAIQCNAPINALKVTQVRAVQKVKNGARALLNAGDHIPIEKKIQIENEIKKYFKVDVLDLSLLKKAATLETKSINENYESHGARVVNYFTQEVGGLIKLETLWREHFLDTMKPQYLPALWSVTHNHSRLIAKAEMKNKSDDTQYL